MNRTISSFVALLVLWLAAVPVFAQESSEAPVDSILNWRVISSDLYTAGQPGPQHMAALKAQGIDTIVSLATPSEANVREANLAASLGMSFVSNPFGDDGPTPDDVEWFNDVMQAQEGRRSWSIATRTVAPACSPSCIGFWSKVWILRKPWQT